MRVLRYRALRGYVGHAGLTAVRFVATASTAVGTLLTGIAGGPGAGAATTQQRARAWFQERAAAWRWRPKGASAAPTSPQNTALAGSRGLVDRLLSQVEALKSGVRELTEAQQQPVQAHAAIQAERISQPIAHRIATLV